MTAASHAAPYAPLADGVRLAVRLTPKAGRDRIEGVRPTTVGCVLAVAVTAPPEGGKANAALTALLAKALGVAKSSVRVTQGGKSRSKTVVVDGDSAALLAKLRQLLEMKDGAKRHG